MNIAALKALSDGDLENFATAATPDGIEAQEAAGQKSLCADLTLPKDMGEDDEAALKAWGVELLGPAPDDLFRYAALPDGWDKAPTDHSMWSRLLDDQGRERASIFYKAAFYDRSAHLSTLPFIRSRRAGNELLVEDAGGTVLHRFDYPSHEDYPDSWDERERVGEEAQAWISKHYPELGNAARGWPTEATSDD